MTDQNPHYVTPTEAGEKYCPFPVQNGPMWRGCVGPKCMAWRWHQVASKAIFYFPHPAKPVPDPNWILEEEMPQGDGRIVGRYREGPTHGYCGMVRDV